MNYSITVRAVRYYSLLSTRNLWPLSSNSNFLSNNPYKEHQRREFSLQATVESFVKTQSGIFRTLSESTPVEYLQNFVTTLHDATGLPWSATIMCTTVLLRTSVTVPLSIYQNFILGKLHNLHLELAEIAKELRKEVAIAHKMYNWDEKTAKHNFKRSLRKQWNALIVRDNCHPVKASLLIWFQIPMWISFSVALRNLVYMLPNMDANAEAIYVQLTSEGFWWITNLTQTDPLFILPVTLGLINLTIVEIQSLSKTSAPTKYQRYALNFFRGFSIFMIPITACVPSGLALYWTTSSLYGLLQNLILMSPRVKRFCRIPQTTLELEKPYSHIFNGLKQRVNFTAPKVT